MASISRPSLECPVYKFDEQNLEYFKENSGDDLDRVHWLPPDLCAANRVRVLATPLIRAFFGSLWFKRTCTVTLLRANQQTYQRNQKVTSFSTRILTRFGDPNFQYFQWLARLITFLGAATKVLFINYLQRRPSRDHSDVVTLRKPT